MALFMLGSEEGAQDIPDQTTNDLMFATPLSGSQESSLNEPLRHRTSQGRDVSVRDHDVSQVDRLNEEMTPSTSFSNSSSQGSARKGPLSNDDALPQVEEQQPMYAPAARSQHDRSQRLHNEHTSAPKRMANGEIKSPGYSRPSSPVDIGQYGHSRNSSRTSRGSQIGELSSQLRTRLSYAMMKVQNGWESRNINELEFMTSNQASPVSALSDQKGPHELALAGAVHAKYSTSPQSPKQNILANGLENTSLHSRTPFPGHGHVSPDFVDITHDPSSHQVGAAYESFWREHEGVSAPKRTGAGGSPNEGPSLAPPVDLVPRNPRRIDGSIPQLPTLHTKNLHSSGKQFGSSSSHLPITPPPMKASKMRTPSQQAAVEKDAVETLLFMSSPGNSNYHPPPALSGTALRNNLTSSAVKTDHTATVRQSKGAGPIRSIPITRLASQSRRPLCDAELDKILDDMPDTSSSDEDDVRENQQSLQALGC